MLTHDEAASYVEKHGNRAARRRWAKIEKKRQKEALLDSLKRERPRHPHTNKT